MSNKSLQDNLRELYRRCDISNNQIDSTIGEDEFVEAITSHMQAGFEYVIGDDTHNNDGLGEIAGTWEFDRNDLREEQRQRAAEWLLGSKEK